jgi:hypothetical protein
MHNSNHLLKKQSEAKLFYSKFVSISCPGLKNETVFFNAAGMRHLIRKGSAVRSAKDQIRRFNLLKYVIEIICNPDAVIFHRTETTQKGTGAGKGIFIERKVDFWSFAEIKDDKVVTVIIRQFPNGPKHFFSIMDKKITKKSPEGEIL